MWWMVWTAAAQTPGTACWDTLVRTHVSAGEVDYTALRGSARPALDACLKELGSVTSMEGWSRASQTAWWINVYNAWTVWLVLENPSLVSIRDLGWPLSTPWKREIVPLQALRGRTLSLDDIEHGILRKEAGDPRVHMVLVCASRSCPALRSEAYVADRLEAQLAEAARGFLADGSKNRVESGELRVSKIFSWYGGDFDGVGGVRGFFAAWGTPEMKAVSATAPLSFLPYDWSLNGR